MWIWWHSVQCSVTEMLGDRHALPTAFTLIKCLSDGDFGWVCKPLVAQLTVGTTVMKNCEPLVPGPPFAMLSVYGRSCLSVAWNSSSNSPPQMLSPPMPVPVGSPVWIIKPCTQQRRCRHRVSCQITAWMCFSNQKRKLTLITLWNIWLL